MRIAVIGLLDLADAVTWMGDGTVEPGAGEVTVTCADATPDKTQAPRITAAILRRVEIALFFLFGPADQLLYCSKRSRLCEDLLKMKSEMGDKTSSQL